MSGRQPTHVIWGVQKNGDKGFWTSIGAAWAYEDGDGMSLKLNLMPLAGQDGAARSARRQAGDLRRT